MLIPRRALVDAEFPAYMHHNKLTKFVMLGQMTDDMKRGPENPKTDSYCRRALTGNFAFLLCTSDWTTVARSAGTRYDVVAGGAETSSTTWRQRRGILANTRHARKEVKDNATKVTA